MKVTADKEGAEAIRELCNVALKAGGLANLGCLNVLNCLEHPDKPKQLIIPKTPVPEPDKPETPKTPVPVQPKPRHKRGKVKKKKQRS